MKSHDPAQDFDFLFGQWAVRHRRLKARLAGCAEWEEFNGSSSAWPLLAGHGNVDDNLIELPRGPYRAATLRALDPQTGQWSIWWLDGRHPGPLEPPMRGSFENGRGLFYADETIDGRPVRVRFIWSAITPHSARWEQAFSTDGGASWETNWEMDFERVGAAP